MFARAASLSVRAILAAALLFAPSLAAGAPVEAATGLSLTLDCYASRERTTIKNTRSAAVTVKTVGSLYKPYSNEPFAVNRTIAAGKSVTYYTGSGASGGSSATLTRRNIYNDDVSSEGVRVTSSAGTFTKRC